MSIPLICNHCQNIYFVKPYQVKTSKCCSKHCLWYYTSPTREPNRIRKLKGAKAHNNQQITLTCLHCHINFTVSPSRIKKKFCSKKCYSTYDLKPNKKKYLRITINGIRYLLHRYIMEESIGRKLSSKEHVHHIDGDVHNNKLSNLQILNIKEHGRISNTQRKIYN